MSKPLIIATTTLAGLWLPSSATAQFRNAFNIRFQNIQFQNRNFNGFAFQNLSPTSPRPTEIRFQPIPFRGLDSVVNLPRERDDRESRFGFASLRTREDRSRPVANFRWRHRGAPAPPGIDASRRSGRRHPFPVGPSYGSLPVSTQSRITTRRQPFPAN